MVAERLQKILARLVYGAAQDPAIVRGLRPSVVEEQMKAADEMLYRGAVYARMFGLDSSPDDLKEFALGHASTTYLEGCLNRTDTQAWVLKSDPEIATEIEAELDALMDRAPWRVSRYRQRFGYTYPVRRAGDGYECIGPDDHWTPAENPHHEPFNVPSIGLWFEAPLSVQRPETLDCTWAKRGCTPADLDGSGEVDETDMEQFLSSWDLHGQGAICSTANGQCDGADIDGNGFLNEEDLAYMQAAVGCRTWKESVAHWPMTRERSRQP